MSEGLRFGKYPETKDYIADLVVSPIARREIREQDVRSLTGDIEEVIDLAWEKGYRQAITDIAKFQEQRIKEGS